MGEYFYMVMLSSPLINQADWPTLHRNVEGVQNGEIKESWVFELKESQKVKRQKVKKSFRFYNKNPHTKESILPIQNSKVTSSEVSDRTQTLRYVLK